MKAICWAPDCKTQIDVPFKQWLVRSIYNLIFSLKFNPMMFCPEHMERVSSGRISDNDPNTNPDLNK